MTEIHLDSIKKAYGETVIMDNMDFTIKNGERLVLLGPSGCGKSTILRMIAGLEDITAGGMKFNDETVTDLEPGKRDVAMVFQNYALYPHMSVKENILYGLKINKIPEEEYKNRYDEVIKALNLEQYLDRKPSELSGGQRQRVALARATVKETSVFLLDEPLSNLDAQLRSSARETLMDIHSRYEQTMVYVTHDQIEAMTFGTRIALLNFGELQQIDTPENIYRRPTNMFTAQFIGNPPMNVLENSSYSNGYIELGGQRIKLYRNWVDYINNHDQQDLLFGIRPEAIKLHKEYKENTFQGVINHVENAGSNYVNIIQIGNDTISAITPYKTVSKDETVYVQVTNDQLHFFERESTNTIGHPQNIQDKIDAASSGTNAIDELIRQDEDHQAQKI